MQTTFHIEFISARPLNIASLQVSQTTFSQVVKTDIPVLAFNGKTTICKDGYSIPIGRNYNRISTTTSISVSNQFRARLPPLTPFPVIYLDMASMTRTAKIWCTNDNTISIGRKGNTPAKILILRPPNQVNTYLGPLLPRRQVIHTHMTRAVFVPRSTYSNSISIRGYSNAFAKPISICFTNPS